MSGVLAESVGTSESGRLEVSGVLAESVGMPESGRPEVSGVLAESARLAGNAGKGGDGGDMREKKRRLRGVLPAVFLVLAAVAGCGADRAGEAERRAVIDDYAQIILLQDQDSAGFDAALAAVDDYVKNDTPEQKEASLARLAAAAAQMERDSGACAAYEAPEGFAEVLERQEISLTEYQINADTRYHSLQGYLQELTFLEELLFYADEGEAFREDLERACDYITAAQKMMRAYNYTGINYWFAGWGEKEREYLKEQVYDQLQSFAAEDAAWEESRDAVEARMNTYLDGLEEINDAWAASLGESWEDLNRLREEIEEIQTEE